MPHRAVVKTFIGHNAYGEEHYDEFEVKCFARERRRLVRTTSSETVFSATTIRCSLEYADRITLESDVQVEDRDWATVVDVRHETDGGFGAWQHLRVELL